jgi:hypothetical protein
LVVPVGIWLGGGEQLSSSCDGFDFGSASEQSVMPDTMEALGQQWSRNRLMNSEGWSVIVV